MIACQLSNELAARHQSAVNESLTDETWEMAMAHKAAADFAWEAVEDHRAKCWRCAAGADYQQLQNAAGAVQ